MGEDDPISTLLTVLAWASSLVYLGIGIAAFARLKATASGLLMGSSAVLLSLIGCTTRGLRTVLIERGEYEMLSMFGLATSCIDTLLLVLFAVGIALLPKSLEKIAAAR